MISNLLSLYTNFKEDKYEKGYEVYCFFTEDHLNVQNICTDNLDWLVSFLLESPNYKNIE